MLAAQGLFAAMNVCTRLGARDLPWSEVAAARFLVGALLALALAWLRGASLRVTDGRNAWRRSLFGTLAALGTFFALASDRISLGDAATLGATAPVFVALLSAPLLGERVGGGVGAAVLLAFAGVVAVVRPGFDAALPVALAATAGAFAYALALISLRRMGPGESSEAIVLHFSLVALATMVAISIPVWRTPDGRGALALLGTGLCGGAAQLAMTRAFAHDHAARLSALTYLGIVFTHLLAIPVFGERPSALQMAGSLLVIGAGLLLTLPAPTLVDREA
jgi:drug/metabolite transporter (DMT)-like permease